MLQLSLGRYFDNYVVILLGTAKIVNNFQAVFKNFCFCKNPSFNNKFEFL